MKSMMSKTYRVVWEIDIDADTPLEAAKEAINIQHDKGTVSMWWIHQRGMPAFIRTWYWVIALTMCGCIASTPLKKMLMQ